MYSMLQRNLKNYFKLYEKEGAESYRCYIAEILKAFIDKRLYENWRQSSPEKYEEVNNLVYHIKEFQSQFPRFETLSWDLWGMGYEAVQSKAVCNENLLETLKIINLCLGTAYWEDGTTY